MTSPTNKDARERIVTFLRDRDEAIFTVPPEANDAERMISADCILALLSPDEVEGMGSSRDHALTDCSALDGKALQSRVSTWMLECFGPVISFDKVERNDRFIEESLELAQATGYSADRAHALIDYVFGRPVGEPHQEVGGVMITLAALCNVHGLDIMAEGVRELERIEQPQIMSKIKAKQAAKPTGSALPSALPSVATGQSEEDQGASRDRTLTVGDGQGNPTLAAAEKPHFRCKRCGRDEIDCRANGCERGPCPMEETTDADD